MNILRWAEIQKCKLCSNKLSVKKVEDVKKVEERQGPEEKENGIIGARGRKRLGDLGLARGEQQEFE